MKQLLLISNFKEEVENSLVTLALLKTAMYVRKVLMLFNAILFSDICSPGYYAGAGNLTVLHVANNGFVSKSCMQPCVYRCHKYLNLQQFVALRRVCNFQ